MDNYDLAVEQSKFDPIEIVTDVIKDSTDIDEHILCCQCLVNWITSSVHSFARNCSKRISLNNINLIEHLKGLTKDEFIPIQARLKLKVIYIQLLFSIDKNSAKQKK